jgi:hypothetical protein
MGRNRHWCPNSLIICLHLTITILDIIHETRRFGDWILSPDTSSNTIKVYESLFRSMPLDYLVSSKHDINKRRTEMHH